MGSFLANGTDSNSRLIMTKLFKQELSSDAEEEGLVPTLLGRDTSMQKVPSVSDLSDPESSLGESLHSASQYFKWFFQWKHNFKKAQFWK